MASCDRETMEEFLFTEPWSEIPEIERIRAMELGSEIIFQDRSAVRFDGTTWVKDDRYKPEAVLKTEADQFLAAMERTAWKRS
jgi:hypothetical protein